MQVNDIKFRASRMGDLMTRDQSRKPDSFGQTAIAYMTEIYIAKKYGRYKDVYSKYMDKGIQAEEDSITLLSKYDKTLYVKNYLNYTNDFITGTPDIVLPDEVHDVKTSWDIFTYFASKGSTLNSRYVYQLQCYMALTDTPRAKLRYCLTNTPESIIMDELRKLSYSVNPESPQFAEAEEKIRREMIFDDIPLSDRVVTHELTRDDAMIAAIYERCDMARNWIKENLL